MYPNNPHIIVDSEANLSVSVAAGNTRKMTKIDDGPEGPVVDVGEEAALPEKEPTSPDQENDSSGYEEFLSIVSSGRTEEPPLRLSMDSDDLDEIQALATEMEGSPVEPVAATPAQQGMTEAGEGEVDPIATNEEGAPENGADAATNKEEDKEVLPATSKEESNDIVISKDEGKEGRSNTDTTDTTYTGSVESTNPAEEEEEGEEEEEEEADPDAAATSSNGDSPPNDVSHDTQGPSSERPEASKAGGSVASGYANTDGSSGGGEGSQRRRSSELGEDLRADKLLTSVNTVDSWGNKEGSLPPLKAAKRNTMPEYLTTSAALIPPGEISDLDDDNNNSGHDGTLPQDLAGSRAQSWHPGQRRANGAADDPDNVANYVNFNKLMTPSSSNYYYTSANRSNRLLLEKVRSKKNINRSASLDESGHSKASMLSQRSSSSVYRGPSPRKKDGSTIKSVMKRAVSQQSSGQSSSNLDGSELSADSLPEGTRSSPTARKGLKRCAFSCVDIREHERVAGDNPCVTSGVPLSLGWGYYQHDPITLDDYEQYRGPPRDKIEMMVPANVRKQMLRHEFGVSISEMNASMKEVNVTKRHRRNTVAGEHLEGWQEVIQSAKRKFKRFVKGTSTKKEEEKMWAEAHKSAMNDYLNKHGEGSLGKDLSGTAGTSRTTGCTTNPAGPKIVPQNSLPMMEISFQNGGGEGESPPSF